MTSTPDRVPLGTCGSRFNVADLLEEILRHAPD